MSRTHARVATTIWANKDWRALSAGAQWTYLMILSQPDLTHAGTVTFNPTKWSKSAAGLAAGHLESRLEELSQSRFVLYDDETFEVLVRSFIRNDGVAKQPKVLMSACRAAVATVSEVIRAELAFELAKIGKPKYEHAAELLTQTIDELAPGGVAEESPSLTLVEREKRVSASSSNPQKDILQNRRKKGFPELPETPGGGGGGYCSSKSTTLLTGTEKREDDKDFNAFCDAYPKPIPASQRIEVQSRWHTAINEHGTDRVLKAAKRYTQTLDSEGTDRKFAKNPAIWFKDQLFVEYLPDAMEPYPGMDVVAWLDKVTEARDVNTAKRWATGDDYLPEWPADYEGWTRAEVEAFRESDKDRWFRQHRELHLEVLQRRYGGARDVA